MVFPDVPPAGWTRAFGEIVQQQLAPVVTRVDSLETSMHSVEQSVTNLEARQATTTSSTKHVPAYVDIKGFCEYEKRHNEGVTRELAAAFFQRLKATPPADAQESLGVPRLPVEQKTHSIRIPILKPEFIQTIMDCFRHGPTQQENVWAIQGGESRSLRAVLEPEPAGKKLYSAFGRLKNYAQAQLPAQAPYMVRDFFRHLPRALGRPGTRHPSCGYDGIRDGPVAHGGVASSGSTPLRKLIWA
ncbi:unnamed protein product, partial [Prorocentrum cordatum]